MYMQCQNTSLYTLHGQLESYCDVLYVLRLLAPVCPSVRLFICLSACPFVYLSVCPPLCPFLYISLSFCLFICGGPSLCLYVCMSDCLYVCLVCLSVRSPSRPLVCPCVRPPVCRSSCCKSYRVIFPPETFSPPTLEMRIGVQFTLDSPSLPRICLDFVPVFGKKLSMKSNNDVVFPCDFLISVQQPLQAIWSRRVLYDHEPSAISFAPCFKSLLIHCLRRQRVWYRCSFFQASLFVWF